MIHLLWNIFKESGQVSSYLFLKAIEDDESEMYEDGTTIIEQGAHESILLT